MRRLLPVLLCVPLCLVSSCGLFQTKPRASKERCDDLLTVCRGCQMALEQEGRPLNESCLACDYYERECK